MSETLPPKKPVRVAKPSRGTVFDVSRPGRTSASSTSKPVIVGHKPMVRDPFVNADHSSALNPKHHLKFEPEHENTPTSAPTPEHDSKAATPELAQVAAELQTAVAAIKSPEEHTPEPEAPAPEAPKPAPDTPEALHIEVPKPAAPVVPAAVAAPIQVTGQPMSEPVTKEESKKTDADHEVKIDPHSFVVSDRHRSVTPLKVLAWLLAVIMLVVIVGDLLLDAGVITTTTNIPHTHFTGQ